MAGASGGTSKDIAEIKAMLADIQERSCSIADIQKTQAVLSEQMEQAGKLIEKISLTVYGNGKPGLTTVMEKVVTRLEVLEKKGDKPNPWVNAAITVTVTLVFNAIFYLILSHGIIK